MVFYSLNTYSYVYKIRKKLYEFGQFDLHDDNNLK